MKYLLTALCFACFAMGCGDDTPTGPAGRPVLNESFTINGGDFRSFSFQIDLAIEPSPHIRGEFSVQGGNVSFAILNESNFQRWQQGQTPVTVYSPGVTDRNAFSAIPITESDIYYLVFINVQSATSVTVNAAFSVVSLVEQEP